MLQNDDLSYTVGDLGIVCNESPQAYGNLNGQFVLSLHIDASVVRTNHSSIQGVIFAASVF